MSQLRKYFKASFISGGAGTQREEGGALEATQDHIPRRAEGVPAKGRANPGELSVRF